MASNGMLIVKMNMHKDIRRFTANADTLVWKDIAKRAVESFDLAATKFRVTYVDDEGDKVTISSDEELSEAVGLALSCTPPVLRLTVHKPSEKKEGEGASEKTEGAAEKTEGTPPPAPPPANKQLADFVETIAKQLPVFASQIPAIANQFPEALRQVLPRTELDVAATLAANAASDGFVHPHKPGATPGVHEGVTCDKSGMSPIVGNRYHLIGHDYDLCEMEYDKLTDGEKAGFRKIPPPGAEPAEEALGFHPGVSCDRSGMVPIVGQRYHLIGHNYDLCQAEYDKLSDAEKALYETIPPPIDVQVTGLAGGAWRGHGFRGGWGRGWGSAFGKGTGGGKGMGGPFGGGKGCGAGGGKGMGFGKGKGGGCGPPLAARFVCDVAVFDGTQVAPGTDFTKIWRIKNSGDVAWPAGTRLLFVGGDQMTSEQSVLLGRDTPVMPGEEVDVAVAMTAPTELGRYLGYWRLTGPHLRRKWGQRIWCHIQVVDPSQPAGAVDVEGALAELEKMKSKLPDDGEDDGADESADQSAEAKSSLSMAFTSTTPIAAGTLACGATSNLEPMPLEPMPLEPTPAETVAASASDKPEANVEPMAVVVSPEEDDKEDYASDDAVLVTDKMVVEAQPVVDTPPPPAPPIPAFTGVELVKMTLKAMGFLDDTMIEAVVQKHGEDVDACASDLAAASEWGSLLDDLAEMGFEDRELNKTLMLKNNGNIKRTVKDLVEA